MSLKNGLFSVYRSAGKDFEKTDANIFVGAGLIDNTGMLVITRTTVRAISETIARCLTMCVSRITDIRAKTLLPCTGGCLQSDK